MHSNNRPTGIGSPTRSRLAAAVAAAALLAGACSSGTDDTVETSGGAGGDASASFSDNRLDASVLAGTATTVGGESFDLAALADSDLVVWFWAPW
jgi:hypothetical protein